jgi:hypothetical protein
MSIGSRDFTSAAGYRAAARNARKRRLHARPPGRPKGAHPLRSRASVRIPPSMHVRRRQPPRTSAAPN